MRQIDVSRTAIIGLDQPEYSELADFHDGRVIGHETAPRILVDDGTLYVESAHGSRMLEVSQVVFHGIFEHDLDLIAGLALWGGRCLPNARAMMDCRLKLPCLVRALSLTHFGAPARGFVSARAEFPTQSTRVAKWGNWHCGENKHRFDTPWTAEEASIVEPFLSGTAMRVVIIGNREWQIQLAGDDWLKSIHHANAKFVELNHELVADTRRVAEGFGLEVAANDYIISDDGTPHLLEVNHIPNVTHFPEIWQAYRTYVVDWLRQS